MKTQLLNKYSPDGNERVGFISSKGIIEVENKSPNPHNSYIVSPEDTIKNNTEDTWATWHTHPNYSSNLSSGDYENFCRWKNFTHLIIGKDGISAFKWSEETKALMKVSIDELDRLLV